MGQFLSYALKMASNSETDETVEYNVNESDNNFEDEFIQSVIREKETEKEENESHTHYFGSVIEEKDRKPG